MDSIDTLIIGAGALGLACAARLARPGQSTLIVEAERLIGSHSSSRNSEVIHAGIYYTPGSLKAELCLEGRERLYAWCRTHQVAHRQLGKLLVAVENAEIARLEQLHENAEACGVHDLQRLSQSQLQALEPAVRGSCALLSPSTGIIDSHTYLQSLLAAAEHRGAQLVLHTRVEQLEAHGDGWIASGQSNGEPFQLKAQRVINAGGLFAQHRERDRVADETAVGHRHAQGHDRAARHALPAEPEGHGKTDGGGGPAFGNTVHAVFFICSIGLPPSL